MAIVLSGTTNDILVNGVSVATDAEVSSAIASTVSAGTIIIFAAITAPDGHLKANGALVSRTVYSDLFAAIGTTFGVGDGSTTFALPDLRAYFPRGWDDARGIDTGRVFGSSQADGYLNHSHTGSTDSQGAHSHLIAVGNASGYNDFGTNIRLDDLSNTITPNALSTTVNTNAAGAHTHNVTVATSTTGTTETRPKNIALLYCIKY